MDHWVIRYTDTKKVTRLVPVLAEDVQSALRSFTWHVKDAVEDSITVLTVEEFKDLREAYGFDRDTPSEDELTPLERSMLRIYNSPEFQARLASGGYDDY
jgi:hypothetical protein